MSKAQGIEDAYPLSPMQQGMLFHSLQTPEAGFYLQQTCYELQGELDYENFERAWKKVVQRHAVLRTAFDWEDFDRILQVVLREVKLPVDRQDWRGLRP